MFFLRRHFFGRKDINETGSDLLTLSAFLISTFFIMMLCKELLALLFLIVIASTVDGNTTSTFGNNSTTTASRKLLGSNLDCGHARVRKSWDAMSIGERNMYIAAVEEAIDRNLFQQFVKIHMDSRSEVEAHETCGFILWHRYYLLAFENMLRSMGSQFKCVTIPYWDTMSQFSKQADDECVGMQECCAIVTGLGGPPRRSQERVYNGQSVDSTCYSGKPFGNYCDDNDDCACVNRRNLKNVPLPTGTSFISLFSIISTSRSYDTFTQRLQNGVHNALHSAIGGLMATYASPADPLFFSWHSSVDMLMSIWHQCHVGAMSNAAKQQSAYAFHHAASCRRTPRARQAVASIKSTSTIFMQAGGVDVRDHPTIGQYFDDIFKTEEYWQYADIRRMGDYTYSYEIPSDFNRILNNQESCPTAPKTTAPTTTPAPTTPAPTTPTPTTPTPTTPAPTTPAPTTPAPTTPVPTTSVPTTTVPTTSVPTTDDPVSTPIPATPVRTTQIPTTPVPTTPVPTTPIPTTPVPTTPVPTTPAPTTPAPTVPPPLTYWEWYERTRLNLVVKFPDNPDEVSLQLEYYECIGFDEKFGTQNFTDEFIKEFLDGQVAEPRCQQILEDIADGKREVEPEIDEDDTFWGEDNKNTRGKSDTDSLDSGAESSATCSTTIFMLLPLFFM